MDYKRAWKYSNRLTVLAVFTVMLGGYFATRSQALCWGLVGLAAVLAAAGFVVHFKWCRCPHCGDRLRVTDWLMRMPKMCPKCHKELN